MLEEIKELCNGLSLQEINSLLSFLNDKKSKKLKQQQLAKELFGH